jgi:two-component system cell cycle sensor histidine kinase/response regulator CckA
VVKIEKQMLENLGYKVTGATSAVDALEMFKQSKETYDLVITDMTMPKMTGLDLAVEIKKVRPDIPILLCTGLKEKDIGVSIQKAGIKGYITKPINKREFSKTIRRMLDSKPDKFLS